MATSTPPNGTHHANATATNAGANCATPQSQVLAEHGSRGLTHGQVDRYAGVPEGTTSYYYRTRAALLRGVGKRVGEIDVANLQLGDRRAARFHNRRSRIWQSSP